MSDTEQKFKIPEVYGSLTDVGNVREHNEDSMLVAPPLFVVADGMGGHEAGEVASAIAVETMRELAPHTPDADALAEAVRQANAAVLKGAEDGRGRPGMGTTMTAALVFDDEVIVAQVGDSRAYLLHNGSLKQVTRDHSLVADLIEQGRITEEEARYHPQRSVITRALGSDANMDPDIYTFRVEKGDVLMLCSDGLSSMITDDVIKETMLERPLPDEMCNALVREALAAGGLDNVTVVVVEPLLASDEEAGDSEPTSDFAPIEHEEHVAPKVNTVNVAAPVPKASMRPREIVVGAPEVDTEASADAVKSAARKRRKGRKAPIIWAIVFVAIIVGACAGFYSYAQNSYYLISENDHVSIYRGLPGNIGGLSFSWLEEQTDIDTNKLAPTTASRLEHGISVNSLEEAQSTIEDYRKTIAGTTTPAAPTTTTDSNTAPDSATTSDAGTSDAQ